MHVGCLCRYFTASQNQTPQTQPARFHGNGHIPGNGHAVPAREASHIVGQYELETYTPMLDHLPENEHSDSKVNYQFVFMIVLR